MQSDTPLPVSESDPEMTAAIQEARSTLSLFFDAFEFPSATQKHFLLKLAFDGPVGEIEHIWIADLDLSTSPATGVIANEPVIPNFQYLQKVTLDPSRITDWMFYEGDNVIGAFTTKLLQKRVGN